MQKGKVNSLVREKDHLLVRPSGPHSVAADEEWLLNIAAACKARGTHKVILDLRFLQGPISQAERYELGGHLARIWPPNSPIALVADSEQLPPDPFFFQILRKRGVTARSFFSVEKAREWLEGRKV